MSTAVDQRDEQWWFDDDAGPLVRPYAVTGGRTRIEGVDLQLVTLVVSVQPEVHAHRVDSEYAQLLWVCEHPVSIAEAAAAVSLPVGVVKVLLADLIGNNYVLHRTGWQPTGAPDLETMQKVLDGIRAL